MPGKSGKATQGELNSHGFFESNIQTVKARKPAKKQGKWARRLSRYLKPKIHARFRSLLYQVVSAGLLPSTDKKHYTRLGRLVTLLREQDIIPRHWIVDDVRDNFKPSSWSGLQDFTERVKNWYRLDFWSRLPDSPFFSSKRTQPLPRSYL